MEFSGSWADLQQKFKKHLRIKNYQLPYFCNIYQLFSVAWASQWINKFLSRFSTDWKMVYYLIARQQTAAPQASSWCGLTKKYSLLFKEEKVDGGCKQ